MIIKKLNDIAPILAGDSTKLKEILHPKNDNIHLPFSLAHAFLEVGEASFPHSLSSIEVYHIIAGAGIANLDGKKYEVRVGDTFLVPPGVVQSVENLGSCRLEFLCIVSPPWSPEGEQVF